MSKQWVQLVESKSGGSPRPSTPASIKAFSSDVRRTEIPGAPTGVRENGLSARSPSSVDKSRIFVLANMIAQTREGKACKFVIPLLWGGRKPGRAVAQPAQCLPRAELDVFPQLATRIFKFSGVCIARGEVAVEGGNSSRGLLLGRSQRFDCFIAPAHPDQRHTEAIVHGEPRSITSIKSDRVLEKTYGLSRSPGFAQSKCKFYAVGCRVRVSLQKSLVGGDGFVRTSLRTQDGPLQLQKLL